MHEFRVTVEDLMRLFDDVTTPSDKEIILKRLKLMVTDYPVIFERLQLLESKFEPAQIKAGKYDKIMNTLKTK